MDPDGIRLRLTILENALTKSESENKRLQHELESTKYDLSKRLTETEARLAQKETELRRTVNKYKPIEADLKSVNQILAEERRKAKDVQKTFENLLTYFYESFQFTKKIFENVISSVTKSLYCIGWVH